MSGAVRVGDVVDGKYRLERELGRGGMGVVFMALHVDLEKRVALKFLLERFAQNKEIMERFWREARAAVKIQSEHVARVMDIGNVDGALPYIVMEYLEGEDLDAVVKTSGPLAVADAVRHVIHTCEALAEVHVQGIVHRDIKPANLFLANRADGSRSVKLLDFGISKAAPAETDGIAGSLTSTNAIIGSPHYMSPEQLRSARDVDQRSDIWALGVTLFELLGARSPFACGTLPEVCAAILKEEPESLVTLRAEVPPALEVVIRRCLEKDPSARWANVAELAIALRPFGQAGVIDMSIERIVGVLQLRAPEPPPPRRPASTTAPMPLGEAPRVNTARSLDEAAMAKLLLDQLGGRAKVPSVVIDPATVTQLDLDHRAGFLLSCIGDASTVDELLDVSGMPQLDTLRLLSDLVERGVVRLS